MDCVRDLVEPTWLHADCGRIGMMLRVVVLLEWTDGIKHKRMHADCWSIRIGYDAESHGTSRMDRWDIICHSCRQQRDYANKCPQRNLYCEKDPNYDSEHYNEHTEMEQPILSHHLSIFLHTWNTWSRRRWTLVICKLIFTNEEEDDWRQTTFFRTRVKCYGKLFKFSWRWEFHEHHVQVSCWKTSVPNLKAPQAL